MRKMTICQPANRSDHIGGRHRTDLLRNSERTTPELNICLCLCCVVQGDKDAFRSVRQSETELEVACDHAVQRDSSSH